MATFTFSTITDPLGVNGNSVATGINDFGQIVGYYSDSKGKTHGFSDSGGAYITLDDPNGTNGTWAYGVTQDGSIVGQDIDNTNTLNSFVFNFTGGYIGVLFGDNATQLFGGANGSITGVEFEALVGNYTDNTNKSHAFLESLSTGPTELSVPSGVNGTFARGVNDTNQVVGYYLDSNNKGHGFPYNGGNYTTLDDPLGVNGTFAQGISDAGEIVGVYVDSSNKPHGFLYSGHTYTTIDDPLGVNGTTAFGVNDSGEIVGQYIDGGGIVHGFLAEASKYLTLTLQLDHLAITRSQLPFDQAITIANSINLGTQTETLYVNGLLSQVANTTIPAVVVEASMYGVTGTSEEITNLTNNFLPAQVANATSHGLNPQVYACEALGLAFAFGNETGSTAFSHNFGPSNPTMPNTAAGDANFATVASVSIFGSASTANLNNVMQGFVSFWEGFFTAHGVPGLSNPTAAQIDLAARGTAWGDMVGVALANNIGPLSAPHQPFVTCRSDAPYTAVPCAASSRKLITCPAE